MGRQGPFEDTFHQVLMSKPWEGHPFPNKVPAKAPMAQNDIKFDTFWSLRDMDYHRIALQRTINQFCGSHLLEP
jgi:hypothetical protein